MDLVIVALGLFKGERFSYARALYNPLAPTSVVVTRVAEELRCLEKFDRSFVEFVEGLGDVEIIGVCGVDKAIIDGQVIEVSAAIHVAKPLSERIEYDAVIGRDLDIAWRLYLDPLTNSVKSLIAKPIEKRY